MTCHYLRADIKAEPTINDWYAWSLLLSPLTFAIMTSNHHLPILESFLAAPELHAQAIDSPEMRGGPFINAQGKENFNNFKQLLQNTQLKLFEIIEWVTQLNQIVTNLNERAAGESLEAFYSQLPEMFRGYIEFYYDLNNYPGFRIIEPLLYKSRYYRRDLQKILLSFSNDKERPFVLSTPLLPSEEHIVIGEPFDSPCYDELFSMRYAGVTQIEIKNFYEKFVKFGSYELFQSYFTDKPIKKTKTVPEIKENHIRLKYFGHACVLLETKNVSILIDPLISYEYESGFEHFTFSDLPEKIDYLLITHAHQDHLVFETLLQLRYKVKTVIIPRNNQGNLVDPSLKLILQNLGFRNCITLDEMDIFPIPEGEILSIPFLGEHGDLNIYAKTAYLIKIKSKNILFTADSNNYDNSLYAHIKEQLPKIDIMFIGMECDGAPFSWLYGAFLSREITAKMNNSRRLNASDHDKSLALIQTFSCKEAYIYAMGQEPWLKYISSIEYTTNSLPILESDKLIKSGFRNEIKIERLLGKKTIDIVD